jgi:hypothetical protein
MIFRKHRDTSNASDFLLERKPTDFRVPYRPGTSPSIGCCCCCCCSSSSCSCCCMDVVGAYLGAYVGGAIGSGIGYRKLRRKHPDIRPYWVALLWSLTVMILVGAAGWVAVVSADMDAVAVTAILVGVGVVFLVNPFVCAHVAGRWSGLVFGLSLLLSIVCMFAGFFIGWAIMGESFLFDIM